MLSCIIPSRSAQYLKKTVDDLLNKAEGEVEVIIIYDGRWPEPHEMPVNDPRVFQLHHGELFDNYGMRPSINLGVQVARGDYIMIIDEQCGVGPGYDRILSENCEDDWVVIPRRMRLEPESWTLIEDGRPPIDYMYVEYPYVLPLDKTQGLHGAEWKRPERAEIMIDDTPTMQGSCYFMKKSYWESTIGPLDDVNYGPFTQEAQEVSMKCWLSGGRVVVNKLTWYSHWHKGKGGKGYGFSNAQYKRHCEGMEKGRLFCIDHWLNTKDYKYDWNWFVTEKFPDMPGWSADWRERVEKDKANDYSTLGYKDDYWLAGLRDANTR